MKANSTPNSAEGPPATTSNAPSTVHAPSSTNNNTNYNNNNNPPAANAAPSPTVHAPSPAGTNNLPAANIFPIDINHNKATIAPQALSNDESIELRKLLKATLKINDTTARMSIKMQEQDEEDASVLLDYAMDLVKDVESVGHIAGELLLLELSVFDASTVDDFEECLSTFLGSDTLPRDTNKSPARRHVEIINDNDAVPVNPFEPPRPFNLADDDEGEDAKLKSEAKQAMAATASGNPSELVASLPRWVHSNMNVLQPPMPFNAAAATVDNDDDAAIKAANKLPQGSGATIGAVAVGRLEPPRPFSYSLADCDEAEDANAKLKYEAKQAMSTASDTAASSDLFKMATSLPQPQPIRLEPPRRFNVAKFNEGEDAEQKNKAKQVVAVSDDRESIIVPTEEDMAEGVELDPAKSLLRDNEWEAIDLRLESGESAQRLTFKMGDEESTKAPLDDVAPFDSELPILEAYAVEEESEQEVVDAIPFRLSELQLSDDQSLPWWKRRAVLGMGCLIVVLVVTVGALVGLRGGNNESTQIMAVNDESKDVAGENPNSLNCIENYINTSPFRINNANTGNGIVFAIQSDEEEEDGFQVTSMGFHVNVDELEAGNIIEYEVYTLSDDVDSPDGYYADPIRNGAAIADSNSYDYRGKIESWELIAVGAITSADHLSYGYKSLITSMEI